MLLGGKQIMAKLDGCYILVVDDDLDTRILLTTALEIEGAVVVAVDSAIAALTALERLQPDLLLCDIAMPEMDGYALLRQLRSSKLPQWNQLPAIALTAMSGNCYKQQSIDAGFQLHLEKPVDLDQLTQASQVLVSINVKFCLTRSWGSLLNPIQPIDRALQLSA
jgi:CheY-like chemotaxis protein